MQVYRIMTPALECCMPADTVRKVAELMRQADCGIIPVLASEEDSRIVGVVTDRDLCMDVVAQGRDPNQVRVAECMTDQVITCWPDDNLQHVANLMTDQQIRRIPVVDGRGAILGMVSLVDIARSLVSSAIVAVTLRDICKHTTAPSAPRLLKWMVQSR